MQMKKLNNNLALNVDYARVDTELYLKLVLRNILIN